jgi:hypothetical protein
MAEDELHFDFLDGEVKLVATFIQTSDVEDEPEASAKALGFARDGITTARRLMDPSKLSLEQFAYLTDTLETLESEVEKRLVGGSV